MIFFPEPSVEEKAAHQRMQKIIREAIRKQLVIQVVTIVAVTQAVVGERPRNQG